MKSRSTVIRDICLMAMLGVLMYVAQVSLAFLPNIELVSLLTILFTVCFRERIFGILAVFVFIEAMTYGFNTWVIMYIYIWPLLALIAWLFRWVDNAFVWACISGIYGLCFGFLCSIVYLFIGGIGGFWAYFTSGLLFDFVHCGGNFLVALLLYRPLKIALDKIIKTLRLN